MTVSGRIDALLESGLIVEKGTDRVTGGRPSRRLAFNTGARVGHRRLGRHHPHDRRRSPISPDGSSPTERIDVAVADGPVRTLDAIADGRARAARRPTTEPQRIAAIGISVPGPVDPDDGAARATARSCPAGTPTPSRSTSRDALRVPVLVANDADAAALGRAAPGAPRLAIALLHQGLVRHRHGDRAGWTGVPRHGRRRRRHRARQDRGLRRPGLPVRRARMPCGGRIGSAPSPARSARWASPRPPARTSGSYLADGDADAARLTQAGRPRHRRSRRHRRLAAEPGRGRARRDAGVRARCLPGVSETLYPRSLPRATRHLTVSQSTLGEHAATVGLAALVVDREYSATAVNAALAR